MTRTAFVFSTGLLALFLVVGCGTAPVQDTGEAAPTAETAPAADEVACACSKGKAGEAVWCDKCNKGYVNSDAVKCRGCYDAKNGGAACDGCAKPAEAAACACGEGKAGKAVWCDKCAKGYFNGEAVKSRCCFDAKTGGTPCGGCAKPAAPAKDGGA